MAERKIVEENRGSSPFMRFYRGCRLKERNKKRICRK